MRRLAITIAVAALGLLAVAGPATAQAPERRTIVGTAADAGQFTTLTKLVRAAGLGPTLWGPGSYTVFAPTDAAFAKVPQETLDALAADPAKLKAVLLYHVVPGRVTASRVVGLRSAKTANGASLRIRVSNGRVLLGADASRVVKTDIRATNGVIHVIDEVLIPPAA